jgi:hypothetical protein
MKVPAGYFFQSAYIVTDIHAAMRRWHEGNGAGPFYFMENVTLGEDSYRHRGTPSVVNFSMAIGNLGPFQIELIQPLKDEPSAYRDIYKFGEEGFHHLGMNPADYDATIAHYHARGYEIAQDGVSFGMRFCYFDARRDYDCMIEVVERVPVSAKVNAYMAEATNGWDGSNPYRPLMDLINRAVA